LVLLFKNKADTMQGVPENIQCTLLRADQKVWK